MPGLKGPSNVQQTTSNTPNPVAMAQLQTAVNTGNSVAAQPYQTYNSPLVAGMNSEQQAAFNNVNSAAGLAQPYIGQAANLLQASTSGIDPTQTLNQYMSPYTQNVLQAQQAIQNQQMGQAMTQSAGSSGAAGANNQNSDRAAIAQGLVGQQLQMANNAANTNTLQQGYNQALQTGLSAQQANAWLESQGANTMANLGAQAQGQGLAGANAQLAAGNQIQQQAQNQINAPLAQYSAAQQYPFQIANYMGNLGSLATGMGGQASTSIPSASPLSQIAGLGLTGLGLYNNGAFSGLSNLFGSSTAATGLGSYALPAASYTGGTSGAFGLLGGGTKNGGRIEERADGGAIHYDGGGTVPDMATGSPLGLGLSTLASGSLSPLMQAGLGAGNPMANQQNQQLQKMSTEQLREMAVRAPQNPALQQVLRQRQAMPQTDPMHGGLGNLGGTGGLGGLPGGVAPAMAHGGVIHAASGATITGEQDADYIPQMLNSTGLGGMTTRDIPEGGYKETDINQLYDFLPNRGTIGQATIDRELGRQPTLETTPMSDQTDQPEDKPFAPGTIGGLTAPGLPALNPGPEASSLAMGALQDQGPPQEHRGIHETPYKLSQFAGGSPFTDDQIQQMLRTGEMIDPAKLPAGSRLPTGAGPNAGGGGGNAGLRAGVGTANIGQGAGLGVGPQAGQAAPVVGNAGLRAGPGTQNAGTTQAPSFSDRFRTAMNDPLTMLGMHLMAGQSRNPLTNLGTAMAGTQQQVEAQAMRQAQARLAMAKEAATEEYQRGRLENSANRTDIYGERVRDQAAATQAHASQVMAMAALRGSQNPKNDAFNELLGTVNPTTGQKYTRAEAYGVISGLEQRQNIANTTHEDRVAALQSSDAYRNGQLALKNAGMNDANIRAIMHDAVQLSAALGKPLDETLKSVASNYGPARNAAMPAAPAQGGPPLSGLSAILD